VSEPADHWNAVYETKDGTQVSWYQRSPAVSRRLINQVMPERGRLVDVGSGTSLLVDELLADGWTDLTCLDVSAAALEVVRRRVGDAPVDFVVSDLRSWRPVESFDVWHDRAVFHFLTQQQDQAAYAARAGDAVRPGGALILGTFAVDGPTQCSGLDVARYDAATLQRAFAGGFDLERAEREEHHTPWGAVQPFQWVALRRRSP
jgi:trans-aconitate methyltransferase